LKLIGREDLIGDGNGERESRPGSIEAHRRYSSFADSPLEGTGF
jgi:hypothetical protein